MNESEKPERAANADQWPGIDSRYRLIVIAALRSKQLVRGATPRIKAEPLKHRTTSIALEEVKQGLVHFTLADEKKAGVTGNEHEAADESSHQVRSLP